MELKGQANCKGQEQGEPHQPSGGCNSSNQTRVSNCFPFFAALLLIIITLSTANSAYEVRHDLPALAFVAFTYSDLMLLLVCVWKLDNLGLDCSPERKAQLKAAVWALTTGLNLGFAWRVASLTPPVVSAIIWLTSGTVAAAGFYGLFICSDAEGLAKNSQLAPAERV